MSKNLTVVVLGGLCNRLRALLSAMSLADETKQSIKVEWGNSNECRAWFDQLFCPIVHPSLRIEHGTWWNVPARKRNLYLPALCRCIAGYRRQFESFIPNPQHPFNWTTGLPEGKHYLSTGYVFHPYDHSLLAQLRPVPHLQARIEALTAQFSTNMVGIHIRRTDNLTSITHSPDSAFIEAVEATIESDPTVRFFLATDSEELKEQILSNYPGRFVVQRTQVRRDTLDGMYEAVVDLYCLAATSRIIGSYWSSFSDMAAELGQIPLQIVKA